MKKTNTIVSVILSCMLLLSIGSINVFAEFDQYINNPNSESLIIDGKIAEKYRTEYEELELQIHKICDDYNDKAINQRTNTNNSGVATKKLNIVTKTLIEGNDVITLGIAYTIEQNQLQNMTNSRSSTIPVYFTATHAELMAKSTYSQITQNNVTKAKLTRVEGKVVRFYDGATCNYIKVVAGQGSFYLPNVNSDTFTVNAASYSKNYTWPYMEWLSEYGFNMGHSATFYIKRGTVTEKVLVQSDRMQQYGEIL